MRPSPSTRPGVVQRKTDAQLGIITQTRKYKLITPLFGGGVEAGKNDLSMPVNGKSIRGQLRFWWRATRGSNQHVHATLVSLGLPTVKMNERNQPVLDATGNEIQLSDLEKLRRLEGEIWGLASGDEGKPSGVQIELTIDDVGQEIHYDSQDAGFKYGAFPMQTAPHRRLLENVNFTLTTRIKSNLQTEVEAALWAWSCFGGLGARTRRGFGAVHCLEINGSTCSFTRDQAKIHILNGLQGPNAFLSAGTWEPAIPHLPSTPVKCVHHIGWREILEHLRKFRQNRPSGATPGRSYWPEPDMIRKLKTPPNWTSSLKHNTVTDWNKPQTGTNLNEPQVQCFPRAAFGLPIVFHFRIDNDNDGEPSGTTLRGQDLRPSNGPNYERLASRLILRPFECSDGDLCVAIVLEGPDTPPGGLILKDAHGNPSVTHNLTSAQASLIRPLQTETPGVGKTDVLQAFLDSL